MDINALIYGGNPALFDGSGVKPLPKEKTEINPPLRYTDAFVASTDTQLHTPSDSNKNQSSHATEQLANYMFMKLIEDLSRMKDRQIETCGGFETAACMVLENSGEINDLLSSISPGMSLKDILAAKERILARFREIIDRDTTKALAAKALKDEARACTLSSSGNIAPDPERALKAGQSLEQLEQQKYTKQIAAEQSQALLASREETRNLGLV